jgi:hypothetical protein
MRGQPGPARSGACRSHAPSDELASRSPLSAVASCTPSHSGLVRDRPQRQRGTTLRRTCTSRPSSSRIVTGPRTRKGPCRYAVTVAYSRRDMLILYPEPAGSMPEFSSLLSASMFPLASIWADLHDFMQDLITRIPEEQRVLRGVMKAAGRAVEPVSLVGADRRRPRQTSLVGNDEPYRSRRSQVRSMAVREVGDGGGGSGTPVVLFHLDAVESLLRE